MSIYKDTLIYRKVKQKYEICSNGNTTFIYGHTKKNKLHTVCTLRKPLRAVLQTDFFKKVWLGTVKPEPDRQTLLNCMVQDQAKE